VHGLWSIGTSPDGSNEIADGPPRQGPLTTPEYSAVLPALRAPLCVERLIVCSVVCDQNAIVLCCESELVVIRQPGAPKVVDRDRVDAFLT
jgi:hypothetical protein